MPAARSDSCPTGADRRIFAEHAPCSRSMPLRMSMGSTANQILSMRIIETVLAWHHGGRRGDDGNERWHVWQRQLTASGFARSEEHTSELQSLMSISYPAPRS